jgi:hypothetical protein
VRKVDNGLQRERDLFHKETFALRATPVPREATWIFRPGDRPFAKQAESRSLQAVIVSGLMACSVTARDRFSLPKQVKTSFKQACGAEHRRTKRYAAGFSTTLVHPGSRASKCS